MAISSYAHFLTSATIASLARWPSEAALCRRADSQTLLFFSASSAGAALVSGSKASLGVICDQLLEDTYFGVRACCDFLATALLVVGCGCSFSSRPWLGASIR